MKTTIKLIRNILEKFNLIANLNCKKPSPASTADSSEPFYQMAANKDQGSSVLDYPLPLLERLAGFIDCSKT